MVSVEVRHTVVTTVEGHRVGAFEQALDDRRVFDEARVALSRGALDR